MGLARRLRCLIVAVGLAVSACLVGPASASAASPTGTAANGFFSPVTPFRTTGSGSPLTLGPGQTLTVPIAGTGSVPADATGVAVNLTVASASSITYLTAYPAGATRPTASSVNADPGQVVANSAQLALGTGGAITVYNNLGTTTFDIDVNGYFGGTSSTAGFTTSLQDRVFDTRANDSGTRPHQPLGPGESRTFTLVDHGVSADATAAVVNVTAVDPTSTSYLTLYPAGVSRPFASTLNAVPGRNVANMATVGIGADGAVTIYNNAGTTDVIVDILGYYAPSDDLQFTGITPGRLADTRTGTGVPKKKVAAASALSFGTDYDGVPTDADAVAAHVTAVDGTAPGDYLTAYTNLRGGVPGVSTLNVDPGQTVANLADVGVTVGPGNETQQVYIYNAVGSIDVVVDVTGYYADTYGDTAPITYPPQF